MIEAPKPEHESRRLAALYALDLLDTPPEADFDDIAAIAAALCGVPTALVSLVDEQRQWFKARAGFDVAETPRETSFCAHAILEPGATVVPDAADDPRFAGNPLVTGGPGIRFYAGVPLLAPGGAPIGTVCAIDYRPRELAPAQLAALRALARQASRLLELRRLAGLQARQLREHHWQAREAGQHQAVLETRVADLVTQARIDGLTGLPNRRAFFAALKSAIQADTGRSRGCTSRCSRSTGSPRCARRTGRPRPSAPSRRSPRCCARAASPAARSRASARSSRCCWSCRRRRPGSSASACARRLRRCRAACR